MYKRGRAAIARAARGLCGREPVGLSMSLTWGAGHGYEDQVMQFLLQLMRFWTRSKTFFRPNQSSVMRKQRIRGSTARRPRPKCAPGGGAPMQQ